MAGSRGTGVAGHGGRAFISWWPWALSLSVAALVDLVVGGVRHFDFHGINGFSTTNYGWVAFAVVGGVGFAWRMARGPLPLSRAARPLIAATAAYVLCFVAVTITALVFLPEQGLGETLTTDAPGRALPVGAVVLVVGASAEVVRAVARARS
ncbi:hypothetical protein [Nocardia sp. NPDC057030]|uniref:hypothetical protein n=1 Tax=unclassified Nocardia TaxID=2637762 RepID=UPI00362A939C